MRALVLREEATHSDREVLESFGAASLTVGIGIDAVGEIDDIVGAEEAESACQERYALPGRVTSSIDGSTGPVVAICSPA